MRIKDLIWNNDFDINAEFIIRAREHNTDKIHDVYCSWFTDDNVLSDFICDKEVSYLTIEKSGHFPCLVIEYNYYEEEGWL